MLFRALDPQATHSILVGELGDDLDEIVRRLLAGSAVVAKDLNFKPPCFCYVLYVNNLSAGSVAAIEGKLRANKAYLGYAPCTHVGLAKTFVSMRLVNLMIKQGGTVILGHEDDPPNTENHNLHLHDYAALGLRLKSLQSIYFSIFLFYKPEQMLLQESDKDLEIALRSMLEEVAPLADFAVAIGDDTFDKYLKTTKLGKLKRAGIDMLTKAELEAAIRERLRMSYCGRQPFFQQMTERSRRSLRKVTSSTLETTCPLRINQE
ncbi:hypothetical protein [Xanthomonas arboricola]|uniref:hypothetical protein n=1 Tax=Xanthomonas arboricola TaxID=56448 RepID=UPI0015E2EFD4|nr:hypothetical protein [Xanthomonas arboricola]